MHLIHVQQKGHWQGGAAATTAGAPLSQRGSTALPLSPLGSASEGGLAIPASPTHATAASAPAQPGDFAAGSPVLAQLGSAGWIGLGRSSSSGGWSLTGLHRPSPAPPEGCSELLERCRQQLLAGSKRWDWAHLRLQWGPKLKAAPLEMACRSAETRADPGAMSNMCGAQL